MFFSTMLRDHIVDRATIIVPSSTANVGLGYDVWCLGLAQPELRVTCTRAQTGVELEPVRSAARPPEGRALGHAGLIALKTFMKDFAIPDGVRLLYEDDGTPAEYAVGDAVHHVDVILAGYESAVSGQPVRLPSPPSG